MPPLGLAASATSTSPIWRCTSAPDPDGKEVLLKYGAFIQTIFEFLIIALVLFMVIKGINRLEAARRRPHRRAAAAAATESTAAGDPRPAGETALTVSQTFKRGRRPPILPARP